eukprot:6192561-Pleurochrysis_carterae.AAC.5
MANDVLSSCRFGKLLRRRSYFDGSDESDVAWKTQCHSLKTRVWSPESQGMGSTSTHRHAPHVRASPERPPRPDSTRSARGRLDPSPLLVDNGNIQLPHESRRRFPAEVGWVGDSTPVHHLGNAGPPPRSRRFLPKRAPVSAYLLIGRVGNCTHSRVNDDQSMGDLLVLATYLRMHRKGNAVSCLVTHASE